MDPMLDPERDTMVRAALRAAGLEAILAWYPEDIVMTCGKWPCLGLTLCLYPALGDPVFYAASCEPEDVLPKGFVHRRFTPGESAWAELHGLVASDLAALGSRTGRIGIPVDDGQHSVPSFPAETPPLAERAVRAILGDREPHDATATFQALGLRKTRREVEALRRTNAAAEAGLRAFLAALVPGATEAQIAAQVEGAVQSFSGREGTKLARGWAHVQAGENIYLGGTYSRSSGVRAAEGDLALLELGTCVDGYWSDLTRTAGVGRIGEPQIRLLTVVEEAQRAAIHAIRPGVAHAEIDAAARVVLAAQGYGAGFTHGCGHHVGFRYHDRGPGLHAGSVTPLEEGSVITVEPGAYGRELGGGARIEDNVLVGASGPVVLSPIGRSWRAAIRA